MEKYLKLPVIMSMENKFIQIRNTYLQWTVDVDKSSSVCEPVTAVISEKCQGFPPIANRFQWNVLWITISRGAQSQNIKVNYAKHMLNLRIWLIVLKGTLIKVRVLRCVNKLINGKQGFHFTSSFPPSSSTDIWPGMQLQPGKGEQICQLILKTSQSIPVFPSF